MKNFRPLQIIAAALLSAVPAHLTAQTSGMPTMTMSQGVVAANTAQQAFTYPPLPSPDPSAPIQITVPVRLSGLPTYAKAFRVSCGVRFSTGATIYTTRFPATGFANGTIPGSGPELHSVYTEVTVPVRVPRAIAMDTSDAGYLTTLSGPAAYRCFITIAQNFNGVPDDTYFYYTLSDNILFSSGRTYGQTGPPIPPDKSKFMVSTVTTTVSWVEGNIP
jgi:hypothetical protein